MSSADAAGIPLLAVLKEKDRERVLRGAKRRTYAPGDVVVREGDSALNLFLIVSGRARVERVAGGVSVTLGPGAFFGEIGLIEQHARTASVIADGELTCILLPAWEFRVLLDEHPEMAVPMVHELIARMHGMSPHAH
ncbi:MAG: cyclic nucleotide-binding domain-containing protein [Candidatus Limnocylindrales bacterium]